MQHLSNDLIRLHQFMESRRQLSVDYVSGDIPLEDLYIRLSHVASDVVNYALCTMKEKDVSSYFYLLKELETFVGLISPLVQYCKYEENSQLSLISGKAGDIQRRLGVLISDLTQVDEVINSEIVEVEDVPVSFGLSLPNSCPSTLTEEQEEIFKNTIEFLNDERKLAMIINGYAGTGKSFLVSEIAAFLEEQEIPYRLLAPTNKAVKNLQRMGGGGHAVTIARALGQVPVLKRDQGTEVYVSQKEKSQIFFPGQIVIVDEFSMIGKDTYATLLDAVKRNEAKIIFVGDEAQLPPVGEDVSPVLHSASAFSYPIYSLKKVIRYEGDVARVAEEIRLNNRYKKVPYVFKTTEDGTIKVIKGFEWLNQVYEFFSGDDFEDDPDVGRVLAWRNKTCTTINTMIRKKRYPEYDILPEFIKGERLIAKAPALRNNLIELMGDADLSYVVLPPEEENRWLPVISNSEEVVVVSDPEERVCHFGEESFSYYSFIVALESGESLRARCLKKTEQKKFDAFIVKLKKEHQWSRYQIFSKYFDNLDYIYALTVHKAQGSTFDQIFLDGIDMMHSPQKQSLLYTALTRTRKNVFVRSF